MSFPSFADMGLFANVIIFAASAVVVWIAGYRISCYADQISEKTGLGHALMGLLLLGGVTSLPELAVTVTASVGGNSALAVNNILGGVAMQVAILAVADFSLGSRALTSVVPDSVVLLQGALNVLLLSIVAVAVIVGDVAVFGIGLWSWLILALFLAAMRLLASSEGRRPWLANIQDRDGDRSGDNSRDRTRTADKSLASVSIKTIIAGIAILMAGYLVSRTGEAIAEQTGLGSSFFGAVFVAISTSLPELSTVLSAVRLGLLTMAISDILGTNLFDIALLFVVDATSSGPPALAATGNFAAVAAMLGVIVTAIFLVGLTERRDRTVFGIGIDSAAIFIAYAGGLAILYTLR